MIVQPNKPPPPKLFLTSCVMEHLLSLPAETKILIPLCLGPEGCRQLREASPEVTPTQCPCTAVSES